MINTKEIAAEYRLAHWAKIMQQRTESGLSIKDFCKHIGICGNTYFYWQRRLRATACKALPDKTSDLIVKQQSDTVKSDKALVPSGWAICEAAKVEDKGKALPIEINGCHILADIDVDAELLAKVCRVLVSL